MDSSTFLPSVLEFIASLPPSTPVLPALADFLSNLVYPSIHKSTRVDIGFLVGLHGLVLIPSSLGLYERYKSHNLWFFKRGKPRLNGVILKGSDRERGVWHPNTAVVTQVCFMVYCLLFMISGPYFSLDNNPTDAAFLLVSLSYIPLGIAFHFMCWSTALAPSTSLSFLSPHRSSLHQNSKIATRFLPSFLTSPSTTLINTFLILSLLLFVFSTLPPTVLMAISYHRLNASIRGMLSSLANGGDGGLDGKVIADLTKLGVELTDEAQNVKRLFKVEGEVYLAWAIVWLSIYIPTSLRLLSTLISRRRRLHRTLASLAKLDELVTQDELDTLHIRSPTIPPPSPAFTLPRSPVLADYNFNVIPPSPEKSRVLRSPIIGAGGGMEEQVVSRPIDWKDIIIPSPPPSAIFNRSSLDGKELSGPLEDLPHPKRPTTGNSTKSTKRPNTGTSTNSDREGGSGGAKRPNTGNSTISQTKRVNQARLFAEKMLVEVGISAPSSSPVHSSPLAFLGGEGRSTVAEEKSTKIGIVESRRNLGKTSRLLLVVGCQFVTTMIMVASYLAFLLVVVSGQMADRLPKIYVPWTAWTFIVPALISSTTFYVLSKAASRAHREELQTSAGIAPSSTTTSPTLCNPTNFSPNPLSDDEKFVGGGEDGSTSPTSQNSSFFSSTTATLTNGVLPVALARIGSRSIFPSSGLSTPNRITGVFNTVPQTLGPGESMTPPSGSGGGSGDATPNWRGRFDSAMSRNPSDEGAEVPPPQSANSQRGWVPSLWAEEQERKRREMRGIDLV